MRRLKRCRTADGGTTLTAEGSLARFPKAIMMTTDALKKLHTAMLDTREGYEVAEKNAETPALTELFGQMITLRSKDHQAIHSTLIDMGEHPDDSKSFMAVVHKSVTSVRAAVAMRFRHSLVARSRSRRLTTPRLMRLPQTRLYVTCSLINRLRCWPRSLR